MNVNLLLHPGTGSPVSSCPRPFPYEITVYHFLPLSTRGHHHITERAITPPPPPPPQPPAASAIRHHRQVLCRMATASGVHLTQSPAFLDVNAVHQPINTLQPSRILNTGSTCQCLIDENRQTSGRVLYLCQYFLASSCIFILAFLPQRTSQLTYGSIFMISMLNVHAIFFFSRFFNEFHRPVETGHVCGRYRVWATGEYVFWLVSDNSNT